MCCLSSWLRNGEGERVLQGFDVSQFSALGETRDVYLRGEGPPVLVMHEMPGITPSVIRLATRIADAGFAVRLPHLFGVVGRPFSVAYQAHQMTRACIGREFAMLAKHEASPIADWLRELGRSMHLSSDGAGIGAVGLCITGNFALTLMVEPWLLAPVLSQPALPLPMTDEHRGAMHASPATLAAVKRRVKDDGVSVLALRFSHDILCPKVRFDALRNELGGGLIEIEIDSGPGNSHGLSRLAHSVLAHDFVDEAGHPTREALERVLTFLRERLTGGASSV